MNEITPELVARLRELDKKASPAPWHWDEDQDTMVAAPRKENGLITQEMGLEEWLRVDNAERNEIETNISYLLTLRNLAKSLLDDHDRLEAENKKLRERLQEATTGAKWFNLTEQIAAGANINWEQLDGVKARCVHDELGALTYKMERDEEYSARKAIGWYFESSPVPWGEIFDFAWEGDFGWTLFIDRPVPLERKTAEEMPLGVEFKGNLGNGVQSFWLVESSSNKKWAISVSGSLVDPKNIIVVDA